jgi:hypothetical protein
MAEWDPVHPIADRVEPRVARALGQAFERMRSRVPVGQLERALARGDLRAAGVLIDAADFEDALEPAAQILADAVIRGGKAGAEELSRG